MHIDDKYQNNNEDNIENNYQNNNENNIENNYQNNNEEFNHSEDFSYTEVESNDHNIENSSSEIEVKKSPNKKGNFRFARKFSAGTKLFFWICMLVLTLILGGEAIWVAIEKTNLISDKVDEGYTWSAVGNSFAAIFLWIGALFYIIIFSWSLKGSIKNWVIFSRNRKAKKNNDKNHKSNHSSKKSKKENKDKNK